jgi:formylglycine-generating enzyme required for sulfatase activity/serine/threonine protein phosphatase PrpC
MAIVFELAGSQIDGARDYQEDAFLITHLTDKNGNPAALVIVADGMGGHAAGNVASNMAVQAISKHVAANYPSDDLADILHECVLKANKAIADTVKETPALAGMGCTLVAGLLQDGKLWWLSVGDSHMYVVRDKKLIKKNADHSYGGYLDAMAAKGTPVEPEAGLARNMLMSAITGDELSLVDVSQEPFEMQKGDRILICSDGIDTLSDGKIIQYSEWSESPKECADALLTAVTEAKMPKQDNTTVVVVNVKEKAEPKPAAAPAPQPAAPVYQQAPMPVEAAAKSNTGLIIGVIVAVAAIGGVTVEDTATEEATPEAVAAPAVEPVAEETAAAEPAPAPAPAPAVAEPSAATPAPAPAPAPAATGKEFADSLKVGGNGPTMVALPGGTFEMGSPGSSRNADERPRHSVTMKPFAASRHEVTFAEYEKFAKAANRKMPDNLYLEKETHPVLFVSWDDAYYYTKWLSEQTGKKYRLPSEAEWEYLAGTGKTTPHWWGFEDMPNAAHCFGCGTGFDPRKPTKIGSFKPNPFGLYDTAGNVAEWVADCWHENYNGAPSDGSVWEGGDCVARIARGGAYSSPPDSIRHQKRDKFKSDQAYDHIGIRVVRDLD